MSVGGALGYPVARHGHAEYGGRNTEAAPRLLLPGPILKVLDTVGAVLENRAGLSINKLDVKK